MYKKQTKKVIILIMMCVTAVALCAVFLPQKNNHMEQMPTADISTVSESESYLDAADSGADTGSGIYPHGR